MTYRLPFYRQKIPTGFKSLQVNCWEISQAISTCQIDFLNKTYAQEEYFQSKTDAINMTIEFCIYELV